MKSRPFACAYIVRHCSQILLTVNLPGKKCKTQENPCMKQTIEATELNQQFPF
jgi:hypothetical protein